MALTVPQVKQGRRSGSRSIVMENTPEKSKGIRFAPVWLLSPIWLSALLLALSYFSKSGADVVRFLTQSPLR